MAEHEASWLHRALGLQRQLDLDVPLSQVLLPHTHNSANSAAYAPSVSTLDANQVLSLTDQLRLGMRAIEIDVHWTPHPSGDPAQGGRAVVQCHGEPVATPHGGLHAGCSVDTLLVHLLREVRAWLDQPAHADEVLLLYLENALDDDPAAHAAAVSAIEATVGDLVARPTPGAGCQALPVTRTKQQLLDAGTRLLVTGNCGPGGSTDWVFERGTTWDESGGSTFDCAAERAAIDFESTLVRRYEDSTWLSAMAGSGSHRDAAQIGAMVRCGVDLVGFDQVHPGDERLAELVWSWRTDEPAATSAGACAALGTDGRFFASACGAKRPVACRNSGGGWAVTRKAVPWGQASTACRKAGHPRAGVPANGWDSAQLRTTADAAGAGDVWLAYAQDPTGTWTTKHTTPAPSPAPSVAARSTAPSAPAVTSTAAADESADGAAIVEAAPVAVRRPSAAGPLRPAAVVLIAALLGLSVLRRRRHSDPSRT